MKLHDILLIGTGHVFDLSQVLIKIFNDEKPDIICVELDEERYRNLITHKRNDKRLPFFFKQLFKFEDRLAKKNGVNVGDDMLFPIMYAQSHQLPFEFIDMGKKRILKMWGSTPKIERFVLSFAMIIVRILVLLMPKKGFEILFRHSDKKDDKSKKISVFFDKFMIEERNKHMAKKLKLLSEKYNKIITCVGDRHVHGISKILESYNIEYDTIRLKKLMEIQSEK